MKEFACQRLSIIPTSQKDKLSLDHLRTEKTDRQQEYNMYQSHSYFQSVYVTVTEAKIAPVFQLDCGDPNQTNNKF